MPRFVIFNNDKEVASFETVFQAAVFAKKLINCENTDGDVYIFDSTYNRRIDIKFKNNDRYGSVILV